jgi:hypothetical protein
VNAGGNLAGRRTGGGSRSFARETNRGHARPTCAAVVALAVPLLAACGGEASSYSLGATFSCLRANGFEVTYHLDDSDYFVFDPIARAAGGGALRAKSDESAVMVVFERSEGDAKQTEAEYRRPPAVGIGNVEDALQRRRNAVLLWLRMPTDEVVGQVTECLKS